jgi:DNA-binding response OmpR family regulator
MFPDAGPGRRVRSRAAGPDAPARGARGTPVIIWRTPRDAHRHASSRRAAWMPAGHAVPVPATRALAGPAPRPFRPSTPAEVRDRAMTAPSDAATNAPPPHLLVVDDDEDIVRLLSRYFSGHGFRVSAAGDGTRMRQAIAAGPVDIVMLDLGLPGEDGFALTRHLREHWRGPVIIVTGRGESVDRVVGLELGADDYVTKPFDLRELLARVRSVLRRAGPSAAPPASRAGRFGFEGYVLDAQAHALSGPQGQAIELTSGEFALLRVFVEQPNQVLSRDHLMTRIHGREAGPFDRSIDVQVGRLRRKIEPDAARPRLIKSVRGEGYLFAAAVRPA